MPKILFVLGRGRSGSTLLDLGLGTLEGFASLGELTRLWRKADRRDPCSCGVPVPECPLWSPIVGGEEEDPAYLRGRQAALFGTLSSVGLVLGRGGPHLEWYRHTVTRQYRRLAEITGARVLVDSSKRAAHPVLLGMVPGFETYAVHLVRDPRAVAWSEVRRLQAPTRRAAARSALQWCLYNLLVEAVLRHHLAGRWLRVRYEDFVASPGQVMADAARLVGQPEPGPLPAGRVLEVRNNHLLMGSRRSTTWHGRVTIERDDEWRALMPSSLERLVTILSWPLLARHGYPWTLESV